MFYSLLDTAITATAGFGIIYVTVSVALHAIKWCDRYENKKPEQATSQAPVLLKDVETEDWELSSEPQFTNKVSIPNCQLKPFESTSLSAQTNGAGLSGTWLRDPSHLPAAAMEMLTGQKAFELGAHCAKYGFIQDEYRSNLDYQRGWASIRCTAWQ